MTKEAMLSEPFFLFFRLAFYCMKEELTSKMWKTLTENMHSKQLHLIADYFSSSEIVKKFLEQVENLTRNIGGGGQYISCYFPSWLDEYELSVGEGFDGIEFSLFENKISVDVLTFRKYLRMACEVYWKEFPETKAQLEEYLARPQPPLEEGTLEEWKRRKAMGEYPKPYSEFEEN